ncbi:hypothetical protein [Burkholderia gladioli]|uniref:hypothetical protein n=1 Tax=Burkholderia gladioli TaxID=28095 RepID=UPI001640F66A|nr:hypothetical protein [Burkholderia gladioli]
MGNSTTQLDQISSTQSNKELLMNGLTDALSPSSLYGRRASSSNGLTWGYYGGIFNGVAISNGTVALTASTTNYVVANTTTGAVSVSTTPPGFGSMLLYTIVTGTTTVTSYTDNRQGVAPAVPIVPPVFDGFTDGNFDSWQAGTSFTFASGASGYTADMWIASAGDGNITVAQGVRTLGTAPSWTLGVSRYTLNITFNTATTSTQAFFGSRIKRAEKFAGTSVTVSASLSSSVAASITAIRVTQVFGTGGSPSSSVTTNVAVSWAISATEQVFSARLDIPSVTGKTLGTNGDDYLQIAFVFANGTTGTIKASQAQLDPCLSTAPAAGSPQPFRYLGQALERKRVERYLALLVYTSGNNFIGGGAVDASDVYAWGPSGFSMDKTPAVTVLAGAINCSQAGGSFAASSVAVSANSPTSLQFYAAGSGATVGLYAWFWANGNVIILLDARM